MVLSITVAQRMKGKQRNRLKIGGAVYSISRTVYSLLFTAMQTLDWMITHISRCVCVIAKVPLAQRSSSPCACQYTHTRLRTRWGGFFIGRLWSAADCWSVPDRVPDRSVTDRRLIDSYALTSETSVTSHSWLQLLFHTPGASLRLLLFLSLHYLCWLLPWHRGVT